jgi:hypothetical protein
VHLLGDRRHTNTGEFRLVEADSQRWLVERRDYLGSSAKTYLHVAASSALYPRGGAELRYANSADPWHFFAIGSFCISRS